MPIEYSADKHGPQQGLGRPLKYPWPEWFTEERINEGAPLVLIHGTDYTTTDQNIRQCARNFFTDDKCGVRVKTWTPKDAKKDKCGQPDRVVIQVFRSFP